MAGTLLGIGVLVLFKRFLASIDPEALHPAMIGVVILLVLLTGPTIGYMSMRLRQMTQRNRELEHTASHDGMTSLLNRSAFTGRVSEKLGEIGKLAGGRGAFLLVDADHFKRINDCHGHAMGDKALRRIAAELHAVSRTSDLIGRLGGEEFGLFLPDANMPAAEAAAERLREAIASMALAGPNGEPVALSVSIGGLFFRHQISFDEMFQQADRKLYEAKAKGRNRTEFEEYDPRPVLATAA